MADNTTLNSGSGGDTIRDKDRSGVKTQIMALDLNPAGAESLMAGVMPVSDNGSTLSVDDGGGSLTVDGTFWQATQPVSGTVTATGPLTDTQLRATAVPVSGTVTANVGTGNLAGITATVVVKADTAGNQANALKVDGSAVTQPVSGTFWQATQPVSLATNTPDVTDRAARLLGHVTVDNASLTVNNGHTQPLTDTQLRASAVPVTGSGTAGTPAAGVQTVQGITGGKALAVARTIDGARTRVSMNYTSTAPVAADTLLTLALNKGGTTSSVTTVPVTAGKVLRITSIIVALRATAATLPWGLVTVRINDSGAALIGSPAVYVVGVSGTAAVIGNTGSMSASIEDGMELSGSAQLGVSFANNVNTNVANISILGYEFVA